MKSGGSGRPPSPPTRPARSESAPPASADNVAALLDASARRAPDRVALIDGARRLTYRELERHAAAFAHALSARGVGRGDRAALILPNGIGFAIALYGALKLGVTVAPLNPQLTADERARILRDFTARVVVDAVGGLESEAPADTDSGTRSLADRATVDTAPPAIVLYTSGSTGRPKGAVLSHAAVAAGNASWMGPVMRLVPDDRVLSVLPLSHSFGINGALIAPLLAGAAVVLLERFAPETVVQTVRSERVTVFPGVATMFQRILDAPGWTRDDFASVRIALSGAAPCPWSLAEAWRARTGVRILRGYGMTELHRPISYLADDPRDFADCIGRPVPGVDIRIVDDEGAELASGEIGELLIRTDAAMDGYLGQADETAATLVGGWFRSGDLARLSPEGFVSVVGRKKELILRGGYSVYPPEVEAALLTHPAVAEAAVIGVPHPDLGEEVTAFVTLRPASAATPDDLVAWCKGRVAGYKCPRVITVLAELPKGPTGKVLKGQLASRR